MAGKPDHPGLLTRRGVLASLGAVACGSALARHSVAATCVREFKDTEYGKTPIRDLLHMSSGDLWSALVEQLG
jgi:hypothetical protein